MKRFGLLRETAGPPRSKVGQPRGTDPAGQAVLEQVKKFYEVELTRSMRENIKLKGLLESSFTEQEQAIGRYEVRRVR